MINRLAVTLAIVVAVVAIGALTLSPAPASAGLSNDNRAAASEITIPFDATFSNEGATLEPDESIACYGKTSVWFKFVASADEKLVARTNGTDFDTTIAAFDGDATTPIICNDDYNGATSTIAFDVQQGKTYFIQVGGYSTHTGNIRMVIKPESEFASIHGTVTDDATGAPLKNVCVYLFDADASNSFSRVGRDTTEADGLYNLYGLDAGNYQLSFNACDGGDVHASAYYHGATTIAAAQKLILGVGVTMTGIDQGLLVGGTISGQVTDSATGAPLPSICVNADVPNEEFSEFAETDANGMYTLPGLNNTYILSYNDCNNPERYIRQYFPGVTDESDATSKTVHPGQDITVNMTLPVGATIQGKVVSEVTGNPLTGVCMEAFLGQSGNFNYVASSSVQNDGTYNIGGLPAGDYKVLAYGCDIDIPNVYYNNKPDIGSATVLHITGGEVVTDINFAITPLPRQGDGNCDGRVDQLDIFTGLRYLAGFPGSICAMLLDVNCNQATTEMDILNLMVYLSIHPAGTDGGQPCTPIGNTLPTPTPHP